MNGITQIRYSPQADWRQYLAQGFGNFAGGLEQQSQRNLMGGDIQALQQYFAGGGQGQFPNVQTNLAQQLMLQWMNPVQQARLAAEKARAAYWKRPQRTPFKKEDVDFWIERGYSPIEARKNARLASEITAGFKPRASSKRYYEDMEPTEKMKFLQTLKRSAEGPYYGVPGGNPQPLEPRIVQWANQELAKLPMLRGPLGKEPMGPKKGTQDPFGVRK